MYIINGDTIIINNMWRWIGHDNSMFTFLKQNDIGIVQKLNLCIVEHRRIFWTEEYYLESFIFTRLQKKLFFLRRFGEHELDSIQILHVTR